MLSLTLREEFRGRRLRGTAIEFSNDSHTGATQIVAQQFLEITYPTHDLLKGIEAVGPHQGRPVVVIGERGLGKSHLMAVLYHAVHDALSTRAWLQSWAATLGDATIGNIALRSGMLVVGESLHRQRHKFLWDLLFERHPHGAYMRGKWEGLGAAKTDVPSDKIIIELLEHTPTMLLLDEFQTWYDGLTNTKQYPWKNWAFNFIQILSEIAQERPDLLVLVVSVRNGSSDAYQQIHRVNPVVIDFKAGGNAERIQLDRRRMILHRLFDNRMQIATSAIEALVARHTAEYFRLLDVPPAEQDRKRREFIESWPFAPHLLRLLEEQVLIATDAQETRDMIRILANLYKSRGKAVPLLTAADFSLDDDAAGIGALLDSVSNEHQTLLRLLRRRIRDARLLRLSGQLLRAGVMAEGGGIAMLLANIYLHELDTWFQHEQRWWQQQGHARYVRTADSFVVIWSGTRSGATRLQAEVATFLQEQLGLELPADRVHIRPLARGFDLLGYRVRRCAGRGTSAQNLIIRPSSKSVMQLKVRIRALTGRDTTRGGVEEKISAMNRLLQNWASSYPEVTSRSSFKAMGRYAFKRMAIWLRKKSRQRVRAVYRAYYRKSGAYRTWAAGDVALQMIANAPETDRRTGEPDAPKGARPVRRGAWGDVPTGNAPGAYSTLGYWAGTLREHA